MSIVRSLRISLGLVPAGSLFSLDDGRVYFRFDDAYAADPERRVLSMLYQAYGDYAEARTRAQLLSPTLAANRGGGGGKLPPFFQNLLPEGPLRRQIIQDSGLRPDDEFGLLAVCGGDLPGNVFATAEQLTQEGLGRLLGQGFDSYEMSSEQTPVPSQVSLSGVQPKVALLADGRGRYVMRSKLSDTQHFIGKLPAAEYALMPEVEFTSMQLAQAAGVHICRVGLEPLSKIADRLPFALREDSRNFLLVHRYDRDADTPTRRRHAEDFAQLNAIPTEEKYSGTYAGIGQQLLRCSTDGRADVLELLRRIKVAELLGNYDAHLKNFSLLYALDGRTARLSPAYDIVAYAVYFGGRGHGLSFIPGQKKPANLTPQYVRALASIWEIPEPIVNQALREVVDRAMTNWPAMLAQTPMTDTMRQRLVNFIWANPSAQAWFKRNPGHAWPTAESSAKA